MIHEDCRFNRIMTFYWGQEQVETFEYHLCKNGIDHIIDSLMKRFEGQCERRNILYHEMIEETSLCCQRFFNKEETYLFVESTCPDRYTLYSIDKGDDHFKC